MSPEPNLVSTNAGRCNPVGPAGIHPTQISDGFQYATNRAVEYLDDIAVKVDLSDREALLKNAVTSLNSKVRLIGRFWTHEPGRP